MSETENNCHTCFHETDAKCLAQHSRGNSPFELEGRGSCVPLYIVQMRMDAFERDWRLRKFGEWILQDMIRHGVLFLVFRRSFFDLLQLTFYI